MRQSPVMDEAGFTRRLEQGYLQMWQEQLQTRCTRSQASPVPVADRLSRARELRAASKLTEASDLCESVLREDPSHADALRLRWDLAFDSGLPGAAIDWLKRALAVCDRASSHYMLGCVLQAQGQYQAAAAGFRRAIELDPASARSYNNLGCLLEAEGRLADAEDSYRQAIALDQQLAPALYNLGNLYRQRGQVDRAVECMQRALATDGSRAEWHCNLGELLLHRLHLDGAESELHAAIAIDARMLRAQQALAVVHWTCGRVDAASAALASAATTSGRADIASASLGLLYYREDCAPESLLAAQRRWAERHGRGVARFAGSSKARQRESKRPLNVGYLVADPANRSVACHFEPLLANHDQHQFNIHVYVNNANDTEAGQRRNRHAALWRDIAQLTDEEAARRVRADGIDILVDLIGHGAAGRMLLMARKPAPVQVGWHGYPMTTGLGTMNFRLTDAVVDPEAEPEPSGPERRVRLPATALCYAPPADLAGVAVGVRNPEGRVVYGSVAPLACVNDGMLGLWSAALRAAPQSRLLIVADGLHSRRCCGEMLERLRLHGISPEQIELRATPRQRAQVFSDIDILLDTAPVDDVTAACDALWMGIPVLTLAGPASASRRVASLLSAVAVPQLVAHSAAEYVLIAAELAVRPAELRNLQAGLRAKLEQSAVMDAATFARQIEAAYRYMATAEITAETVSPAPAG
jgi:predicted O-linked N-acetylglucosamine transferase (SPINDLY family)